MRIVLPWPPTANTSKTISRRGRLVSTKKLRDYHRTVWFMVAAMRLKPLKPPYSETIYFHEPRLRGGDLSNSEKAINDALVKAGVLKDDRFIDEYKFVRCDRIPEGKCVIEITEIDCKWGRL